MKQVIIGLVAVIYTVSAYAQPTTNQGTYFKIKLEEVVVKDSSGTVYPTELVKQLIATGKYSLRLSQDRTTGILTKAFRGGSKQAAVCAPQAKGEQLL